MNLSSDKSHRQYIRIPFSADVQLKLNDHLFKVHLVDIALKGALVQCAVDHPFVLHEKCSLLLPMGAEEGGIVMVGQIAHLEGNLVGIECLDFDVASLTRLRRLIELNSGDPKLLDREIRLLFGSHWAMHV